MFPKAMSLMTRQRGLITRSQARDCGLSDPMIRRLVRDGTWVLVRRSVYAEAEMWNSVDDRERSRLRTRAAMATMSRAHVASHDSSAHEHDLEILAPDDPLVHVTRPGVTNAWVAHGVKVHLARYASEQVVTVEGLETHDLARTAVDIAREHGSPYGEVACDSAMRKGVSRNQLMAAYEPMTSWPHVTRVRAAVDFADPRSASVLETLARLLVAELGLGEMDLQFPARLRNGQIRWGDIRVGCHLFEADGKVKFTPVAEGGVATKSPAQVAWDEKLRDRDLRDVGLGVSHIVYADIFSGRAAARRRLLEEYAHTVAMFGETLPAHLVRDALELRGIRGA